MRLHTTAIVAVLVVCVSACGSDDNATIDTLGSTVSSLAASETTVDSTMSSSLDSGPTGTDLTDRLDAASVALQGGDFTTLRSALRVSGLGKEIENRAVTLLAPTDTAFKALSVGQVTDLLSNPTQLDEVLRRHVLDGAYTLDELRSMRSVTTIGGDTLTVESNGSTVRIDGATVTEVSSGSGDTTGTSPTSESGPALMVYRIDKVLLAG